MQEEKEKIFSILCNWENKPLIETEKRGEIPSGKVNNKPLQARCVQEKMTKEHLR